MEAGMETPAVALDQIARTSPFLRHRHRSFLPGPSMARFLSFGVCGKT